LLIFLIEAGPQPPNDVSRWSGDEAWIFDEVSCQKQPFGQPNPD